MHSNKHLILIIDDVPKNIQVLANILYEKNYELAIADSGFNAIEMLKHVKPDLILLDVMMPEMDGFELCSILKKQDEYKDIPIIFLTAMNDTQSIIKGFELGAVDFVSKPFNASELLARVKTQISLIESKRQLQELNNSLEQKVNQKTIELKIANEKLSKLDNAKNYLLGLLSHELNTPITQIKAAISLLKLTEFNEENKEIIESIEFSAKWLEKIATITKLITALKAEKYEMRLSKFDICFLINDIIFNLNSTLQEKNIIINTKYPQISILVNADYDLLYLFFNYILDNAIKHTPNNSEIIIEIENNDKECIISVIDSGKGFNKEYLEEQFELFNSDNLINHKVGIGLSLTASKLIIESHGGKLILGNVPEKGAIVTAILPLI